MTPYIKQFNFHNWAIIMHFFAIIKFETKQNLLKILAYLILSSEISPKNLCKISVDYFSS